MPIDHVRGTSTNNGDVLHYNHRLSREQTQQCRGRTMEPVEKQ